MGAERCAIVHYGNILGTGDRFFAEVALAVRGLHRHVLNMALLRVPSVRISYGMVAACVVMVLALVLGEAAWAQQKPGNTLAFPQLGLGEKQQAAMNTGFAIAWAIISGSSGNTGSALYYLALTAAVIGLMLIVVRPAYRTPTTIISWFVLTLVLVFAPYNSRMLFYPVVENGACAPSSSVDKSAASKGQNVCGFTPQVIAAHLGTTMSIIFYDIVNSSGLKDAVEEATAQRSLEGSQELQANKDAQSAFNKFSSECPGWQSGIRNVLPKSMQEVPATEGSPAGDGGGNSGTSNAASSRSIASRLEDIDAAVRSGNAWKAPPIVLYRNQGESGLGDDEWSKYEVGLSAMYNAMTGNKGKRVDSKATGENTVASDVAVTEILSAIKTTAGDPGSLGFHITDSNGLSALNKVRELARNSSAKGWQKRSYQNSLENTNKGTTLGSLKKLLAGEDMKDMPSGGGSVSNGTCSNPNSAYSSCGVDVKQEEKDCSGKAEEAFNSAVDAQFKGSQGNQLLGNAIKGCSKGGTIDESILKQSAFGNNLLRTNSGSVSCDAAVHAFSEGMQRTAGSANPNQAVGNRVQDVAFNPNELGLSRHLGGLAGFIGTVVGTVAGWLSGATAVAVLTIMKLLVDLMIMTLIVVTPLMFLMGVLIPGNAPGMLIVTTVGMLVLKMVPVTLLVVNFIVGILLEGASTYGLEGAAMQGLLLYAAAGMYMSSIGLTMFIMFKMGDPSNLAALRQVDSAAAKLGQTGVSILKSLAVAAAIPLGGAVAGGMGAALKGGSAAAGAKAGLGKAVGDKMAGNALAGAAEAGAGTVQAPAAAISERLPGSLSSDLEKGPEMFNLQNQSFAAANPGTANAWGDLSPEEQAKVREGLSASGDGTFATEDGLWKADGATGSVNFQGRGQGTGGGTLGGGLSGSGDFEGGVQVPAGPTGPGPLGGGGGAMAAVPVEVRGGRLDQIGDVRSGAVGAGLDSAATMKTSATLAAGSEVKVAENQASLTNEELRMGGANVAAAEVTGGVNAAGDVTGKDVQAEAVDGGNVTSTGGQATVNAKQQIGPQPLGSARGDGEKQEDAETRIAKALEKMKVTVDGDRLFQQFSERMSDASARDKGQAGGGDNEAGHDPNATSRFFKGLRSGFYGGWKAMGGAGSFPVIGGILKEMGNEWHQAYERNRAADALPGGWREYKQRQVLAAKQGYLQQEMGAIGASETYMHGSSAAMVSNTRQAAREAAAAAVEQYQARARTGSAEKGGVFSYESARLNKRMDAIAGAQKHEKTAMTIKEAKIDIAGTNKQVALTPGVMAELFSRSAAKGMSDEVEKMFTVGMAQQAKLSKRGIDSGTGATLDLSRGKDVGTYVNLGLDKDYAIAATVGNIEGKAKWFAVDAKYTQFAKLAQMGSARTIASMQEKLDAVGANGEFKVTGPKRVTMELALADLKQVQARGDFNMNAKIALGDNDYSEQSAKVAVEGLMKKLRTPTKKEKDAEAVVAAIGEQLGIDR